MRNLLDILSFVFPCLFLYLIIRISVVKRFKIKFVKDGISTLFVIYIAALVFIVWIKGRSYTDYLPFNFFPLKTIIDYIRDGPTKVAFENIFGNIILTMPFGFFAYFNRVFPHIHLLICSLLISCTIELGQFLIYTLGFGSRSIDIDDIILNTTGLLLGYYFTKFIGDKSKNKSSYLPNKL